MRSDACRRGAANREEQRERQIDRERERQRETETERQRQRGKAARTLFPAGAPAPRRPAEFPPGSSACWAAGDACAPVSKRAMIVR